MNNRIDPSRLSPAAVGIMNSGWIPIATNPCGDLQYDVNFDNNDEQYVIRSDYQLNANHSIFGRFFDTFERRPSKLDELHNIMTIQTTYLPYRNRRASMLALGDTQVLGANMVNSFRFTFAKTKTRANDPPEQFFSAEDLGIPNIYTYVPGTMNVAVNGGDLRFSGNHTVAAKIDSKVYQVSNDLSRIVGRHQIGVGTSIMYSYFDGWDYASANGSFTFNGRITGLPLGDFLTGQMSSFSHGSPNINTNHQWYVGVYGQDAWTVTDRVTLNLGLRWDPYQGVVWEHGTISNFSLDNFYNGVRSTQFPNAPPGLLFPGDEGMPPGTTGMKKQWLNFSPRAGVAWDVMGDGRTAVRGSYALNYDYPSQAFMQPAANVAPFNNRTSLNGNIPFDNPYSVVPGGPPLLPTPIPPPADAVFPFFSSYTSINPNMRSIRVQTWNGTIEQQIGAVWQVAASYIGSHIDRIWGRKQINPGVYLGPGSTASNIQSRRVFSLADPAAGQFYTTVYEMTDVGLQDYRGLKLSVRRRTVDGISLSGNYTVSHCETDSPYSGLFISTFEYTDPENPSYDRGNCPYNRTHIANLSVGYLTPQFGSAVLRAVASDWRVSGVLNANSGNWLTVTTTSDPARTGIGGQRVNQVKDNPYGAKTLDSYLDPTAFAVPAVGTLGNHGNRSIEGPRFWQVNLALARVLRVAQQRTLELRVEVFNLFDTFNWGDPATNFNSGTFGRITTQQSSYGFSSGPRVMQFAAKYAF